MVVPAGISSVTIIQGLFSGWWFDLWRCTRRSSGVAAGTTEDFEFTGSGELFRGGDGGAIGTTAYEKPEAYETECEKSSHYCSSVLSTTPSAIEDMFWNAT